MFSKVFGKADPLIKAVETVTVPEVFNPPVGYESFDYMGQTFTNVPVKPCEIKGIPHIACTEWSLGDVGPTLPAIGFANEKGEEAQYWVFPWNAGSVRDEVFVALCDGTYGSETVTETELNEYEGQGYVNYQKLKELLNKSESFINIKKDRHYQIELQGDFTAEELKAVIALHEAGINFGSEDDL